MFCALAAIVPLMLVSPDGQPWAMEEGALFYGLLYKSRLVPRFLSVWGVVGVGLILAMNLLSAFGRSAFPGNHDGAGASDDFERSFPGALASCEGICPRSDCPVRRDRYEGCGF